MSDWIVTFICLVRYTRIVISIGFLAVLLGCHSLNVFV